MIEASTSAIRESAGVSASLLKTLASADGYKIDPLSDPRWAALVETHPRGSVFHSANWLRALCTVYGYKPVVVTTSPPGEQLANGIVFCGINSWLTGRRLVSLPFSDHCEPLVGTPDEFDALLLQLKQQVDRKEWKYVEIRPVSYLPSCNGEFSRYDSYHLHCLDLRLGIEQVFQNFHKDCVRRKIRRAEREKLTYAQGTSEVLLQDFYRLLLMTRRRQGLPPQPLGWFRALVGAFGRDIQIRVAYKDSMAVASILTLSHKRSMLYKYGCSNAAFNNLGGTALLFWKTIQEAKDGGFEKLEMGRSDTDNFGLAAFKEHWGATRSSISYWSYPQEASGLPAVWKRKLARPVISTVPDAILKMIGKLLYKHAG